MSLRRSHPMSRSMWQEKGLDFPKAVWIQFNPLSNQLGLHRAIPVTIGMCLPSPLPPAPTGSPRLPPSLPQFCAAFHFFLLFFFKFFCFKSLPPAPSRPKPDPRREGRVSNNRSRGGRTAGGQSAGNCGPGGAAPHPGGARQVFARGEPRCRPCSGCRPAPRAVARSVPLLRKVSGGFDFWFFFPLLGFFPSSCPCK